MREYPALVQDCRNGIGNFKMTSSEAIAVVASISAKQLSYVEIIAGLEYIRAGNSLFYGRRVVLGD